MREARAMEHVRQLTTIPIPRVHWAFVRDSRCYIVMDRVKGQTLRVSKISDPATLRNIAQSINSYQRQLETLGTSRQSLGSWPEGPYRNSYFKPALQETMLGIEEPGDFQSVVDFHNYWHVRLGHGAVLLPPEDSLNGPAADIVLMHADLNDQNIMVDNGIITAILDWETFGWYPRFWDSLLLRSGAVWSRPWSEVIFFVWGEMVEPERSYSAALGRFWSMG
ncbi:kinase-like domain-containing protein [Desarmillaria tabescens]|uniref:Kinase-like domain-containing protein n=1 Tax=Armillaria tabescens TaxID=1929756 RepID=A0AA39NIA7_ARMTA|nr:kinase-like domain-containing protein [Desarmillaria tabescens]KAK0466158.1 kinase-like domain-containing protein [Desarmillaria tabescens]